MAKYLDFMLAVAATLLVAALVITIVVIVRELL